MGRQAQDSFPEPEGDGGGESDGTEEGVGAAVFAHGDSVPVLEPAEHDLDAMALAVEQGVVRDGVFAAPR